MPSGTMELVVNLHEDELPIYDASRTDHCKRFSGAVVCGAYGKPFVIDTREHVSVMGVHFKPGGAFPFLVPAASELADSHVDLDRSGELRPLSFVNGFALPPRLRRDFGCWRIRSPPTCSARWSITLPWASRSMHSRGRNPV